MSSRGVVTTHELARTLKSKPSVDVTAAWFQGMADNYERMSRDSLARVCPGCGNLFVPTRSDRMTCSNVCRQRVYRNQVRDRVSS
jgi:hypothetical protein